MNVEDWHEIPDMVRLSTFYDPDGTPWMLAQTLVPRGGVAELASPSWVTLWHVSERRWHRRLRAARERGARLARAARLGDRRRARARVLVPARLPARHVLGGRVDERGRRRALSLRRPRAARARDRRRDWLGRCARRASSPTGCRPSRSTRYERAAGYWVSRERGRAARGASSSATCSRSTPRRYRAADRAGARAALGARRRLDARVQRHPPAQPRRRRVRADARRYEIVTLPREIRDGGCHADVFAADRCALRRAGRRT